jgi:alanyl-tRNA synthetase
MRKSLDEVASLLKAKPEELTGRIMSHLNELKELKKSLQHFQDKELLNEAGRQLASARVLGDLRLVKLSLENVSVDDLRKIGDFLKDKEQNLVAVLSTVNGEKLSLLAVCGKGAIARGVKAGDIIKTIAPIVGGRGGGKPDSAMGGGSDIARLSDAMDAVEPFVNGKL